ncbi:MAG: 16S rRNA (uracil(1498)-N(3))-methyltransferase [Campylobacterales bacterium]|nr:16S rRNA (uracil(1498)-N(3))-methyltransferase [Campylobacterales bacterium]
MVFSYDEKSGADILKIEGDTFRHLFLARRSKDNESFLFCNLQEPALYEYKAINVSKKDATLELITKHEKPQKTKKTALGWCVVDPKTIEKTLPMLNEIGIDTLYFVYADRSQKNFKIDMPRLQKILINSCCQCGRMNLMSMEVFKNVREFVDKAGDFCVFDFGGALPSSDDKDALFLIGPEGGFSDGERELLKQKAKKILSFDTPNILRSETAVLSAASLGVI